MQLSFIVHWLHVILITRVLMRCSKCSDDLPPGGHQEEFLRRFSVLFTYRFRSSFQIGNLIKNTILSEQCWSLRWVFDVFVNRNWNRWKTYIIYIILYRLPSAGRSLCRVTFGIVTELYDYKLVRRKKNQTIINKPAYVCAYY